MRNLCTEEGGPQTVKAKEGYKTIPHLNNVSIEIKSWDNRFRREKVDRNIKEGGAISKTKGHEN